VVRHKYEVVENSLSAKYNPFMTTKDFDRYFMTILDIEGFIQSDHSMNGLQVDNDGRGIGKVAFAVDACMETFERTLASGADILFVHHGLFWGAPLALTGSHRQRIAFLLKHNIALYAVHLPLDQHPVHGNNAALAELLGISDLEPFGEYHGKKIGYKGKLTSALTVDEAAKRIEFMGRPAPTILPFGARVNTTCAVISGGASHESTQAIAEGVDLYVTGEASHTMYHTALEGKLNVVAGGHYSTEVWGVRKLMLQFSTDSGLETEFIDAPTGL